VLSFGTLQTDRTVRSPTSSAAMRSIIWKYSKRMVGALQSMIPKHGNRFSEGIMLQCIQLDRMTA
jgi:hypothetical protein